MSIDLTEYDLIIMGTPIWAGQFAPVFNTFLKNILYGKEWIRDIKRVE